VRHNLRIVNAAAVNKNYLFLKGMTVFSSLFFPLGPGVSLLQRNGGEGEMVRNDGAGGGARSSEARSQQ